MPAHKVTHVAQYARVSTTEQVLDNQFLILDKFVAFHEHWSVVERYSDKVSGSTTNRPGLDRMMEDARKHRFDVIICTKLDRMARSTLNLSKICAELDDLGIGLVFVEQSIDTTTPEGRMVRTMLSAIAEFELELNHSRTKDGIARARAQGKTIGRPEVNLSKYQLDKAKEIIAANPNISENELTKQFQGMKRTTLIRKLRQAGLWPPEGRTK